MVQTIDIKVFPDQVENEDFLREMVVKAVKVPAQRVFSIHLVKKSLDARGRRPYFILRYDVFIDEKPTPQVSVSSLYQNVTNNRPVVIVGAGPAGYFAALECLISGIKPIVLERGKPVQERRRDLRAIQQFGEVNPDSNYCFGEGGAGTYSDGKLYTRSHKRGKIDKVLRQLTEHGAPDEILSDAHPHIGSNKLPKIIEAIRQTILTHGGEVWFDKKVCDISVKEGRVEGVHCTDGSFFETEALILATGHSARDIFSLFAEKNWTIEAKDFALGLRIEHAQKTIDRFQYHQAEREENLPAASYAVVAQVENKGVFSFCMCPGGLVVPAATSPGEIVVNGMSLSRRDSPFANSGFVTSVSVEELKDHGYKGIFAAMDFQRDVEQKMFSFGDGTQKAPAQRVQDFVDGIVSSELNATSYIPGLISAPLHQLLPSFIYQRLRKGLIDINKKMRGYLTNEANIIGVESRTSSPVKIPRDDLTLMHPDVKGLFPCGEGAGYAGGILSAAMDGQRCAAALVTYFNQNKVV
ncbi:MAG: FAD-binding protein [Saprospiraceae bacterium]|nr:FAD-binding protein [Saprospiraceae bacterium]